MGERSIGLAIGDPSGLLASPLTALRRASPDADVAEVLRLAQTHQVEHLVVGIPVSMSGREGPQARVVRRFVRLLRQASPLPVDTWDERLSTVEAERRLRQAGVEASRHKERVDAAAAAIILQAWLDAHREES